MNRTRRNYDKEFKEMAVDLINTGRSIRDVADELGIQEGLLRRWKREKDSFGTGSFSGKGNPNLSPEQAEIARLKKALRESEIEREILKKAVSIFSRSDGKYTSS